MIPWRPNMPGVLNWYDHAEIYDILCSWDPAKEVAFLEAASRRFGLGPPERSLEPFCGSGRLLRALGPGASGFDINPAMLRYAARESRVFRADAGAFAVRPESFDFAFCLIDSFRYLLKESQAVRHMRAVARALKPGGLYVMGFDVTGAGPPDVSDEKWESTRDGMTVRGAVGGLGDRDTRTKTETLHVQIEAVRDDTTDFFESFQTMRVYAPQDVRDLVAASESFELVSVHDRAYDLDQECDLKNLYGSAVLILRRDSPIKVRL